MRGTIQILLILALALSACGFGLANDSGSPEPAADYWGWQCADGTTPAPDAGCPVSDGG